MSLSLLVLEKNKLVISINFQNIVYPLVSIYISRKTLRSLRPEIGEFAGRAGEDRVGEGREGQDRARGQSKIRQSKSRAGRG